MGNVVAEGGSDLSLSHRLTVDYPEDHALVAAVYRALWSPSRPAFGVDEIVEFLADHPEVVSAIERGLAEVMTQFNNAERVKKVRVLAEEWLPDSEELTPTSKLKRRGIHAKYEAEIEAIYR